jgi:putative sigma-54 modulation protein
VEASAYASIDVVCDKVRGKLRRLKEKAMQAGRWPGSARPRGAKPLAAELADEGGATSSSEDEGEYWDGAAAAPQNASDPALAVIREKTFVLTRMSAADAAEAADLLGHSFYVYQDAATGGVRVVYKRAAEGWGVITPQTSD